MFVAAIVDALPALAPLVLAELAAVRPAGMAQAGFSEATTGGLRARRFGVASTEVAYRAVPARSSSADTAGAHAQQHGGTGYPLLRERIAAAPLSASTRTHALALLALLAGAEAHVHGTSIADVHFHELGDWDSLLDVVAAGCIAANLDGARWTASALPLGGGVVRTSHGLLPVPAPATSFLLTGYPWRDDGIAGERVTPTGAAILRHLVPAAQCSARREAGRLVSVGCGAGTRVLPGLPNMVRALVLERGLATGRSEAEGDVVAVLEFDVDDMTGEEIALAADHLRTESGVIDVSIGTRQGKKGQAGRGLSRAGSRQCGGRNRTGLLYRDDHARLARARGAPAGAAAHRSRDRGRRCHRQRQSGPAPKRCAHG